MKTSLMKTMALLTLSILVNMAFAGNWKNLSNYASITQVTVHGNDVWVSAKGGLLKYDKINGTKTYFEKGPGQLPSLSVERVLPNMITGDIWIGTYDNGLASFDGSTWHTFPYPDRDVLLYEMKMADNGTIWCATTRGIYKFENGQYTTYLPNGSSSASMAWDIDLLPGGKLLCGGNQPFIYDPATDQYKILTSSTFAYGHSIVYVQNDSTFYFGSDHGDVAKFIDTVEVDTFHTPGIVQDMQQGSNGNLLVLTSSQFLYEVTNGHTFTAIASCGGSTTAFTSSENGELWQGAITDNFPMLSRGSMQLNLETINLKKCDLNSNWVRRISGSADGNVMVISDYGIQKYDLSQNTFTDVWEINNQPNISEVIEVNGKLYAGASAGYLNVFENNQWTQLGNGILPNANVDHLDVDADNNIWMCGPGYVAKYDGAQFTVFTQQNAAPITANLYLRDIHCDKTRNTIWVGSFDGIIKYANGVWTSHNDQNTPGIQQYYDAINTIAEDAQHNMYFGTIYGAVLKYDGTNFSTSILPEHVGNQSLMGIAFVGNTMYVADNLHGVWVYENNQWDSLNTRNSSITDGFVSTLYADANNNLWIGNLTYGVDVYNKNGVVLSVEEARPVLEAMVYPNPSNGRFNIQVKNADAMEITVTNLSGQIINKIKANSSVVIDLSNQPKGLYIATVNTAAGSKNIKLSFH